MNIDFLKTTSKMLTEDIEIADTDEIVDKIIEQKYYSSLPYQVCEVSPIHSIQGGVYALKYVDDPAFPGRKKVVLLRNNIVVQENPIEDTGFTVEAVQDLLKTYGKSAIDYITKIFAGVSTINENQDFINYLSNNALTSTNHPVDPYNSKNAFFSIQQKVSELILQINSNSFKTLEAFCILPEKWAASVIGAKNFMREGFDGHELFLGEVSRIKYYLNPVSTSNECFVGVHSKIPGLSSLVFSPYHHAIKVATNPETGQAHIFNFNRYAITENTLSASDASEKMIYKFEIDEVPGAGGGGSPLTILDEGSVVNSSVCKINFIGADVQAKQDGNDNCEVDVYIPTPSYPSHLNTTDGTTNGIVSDTPTTDRHISNPGFFDIGDWDAGSTHPVVNKS